MHPDYTLTMDDFDDDMQLDFTSQPHDYQVHESGYAFDVEENLFEVLEKYKKSYRPPFNDFVANLVNLYSVPIAKPAPRPLDSPSEFEKIWTRTEPPGEIPTWDESESIGMPGKPRDPIR